VTGVPAGGEDEQPAEARGHATFEAVVRRHGATVLRVCRALLGPADADDAWSETFPAAMRAHPALPADANVEAWLVTIAHRKAIDILRASGRRAVPVGDLPDVASYDDQQPVGDPTLMEQLAALPTKQHDEVVHHYIAQLPYARVAEVLGGTTESARRAAADGMAKLRRSYPPSNPETGAQP
jgi:RNA polymerase sigma factor (sigma-70 family)